MEDDATVSDQAQASAEEAASFAAGFDGTTENAPAKADAATETTAEARTTAEEGRTDDAAPGATAAAAPAASEYVQITREEWERFQNQQAETQAELGRVRDQANGQFGGLQRVLAQASAPRKAQRGARLLRIDKPARMIDDAVRMRALEAVARSQDSLG